MELLNIFKPNISKTFYIISKCYKSNTYEMKLKYYLKMQFDTKQVH